MKKAIGLLSVLLLAAGFAWAQSQQLRLGELARKVRTERASRDLSRVPFFTNDTLPKQGGISVVGGAGAAAAGEAGAAGAEGQTATAGSEPPQCDEPCWRGKFREQRAKIQTAQRELDILQREYNLARTQYYQDPNQAMREQYSGTGAGGNQLQQLLNQMNDKRAEIERLQGELGELENQLRREGGQPGWARE